MLKKVILFAYFFLKLIALGICAFAGLGICSQADTRTRGWQIYEFVISGFSIWYLVYSLRDSFYALDPKHIPRPHPMRRQTIFRLFESVLAGMTLHLLARAQMSYSKSPPFNVCAGKSMEAAWKTALFASWGLLATDAAEFLKSVGKMLWDGRKGCGATGAGGSGDC